ncbi:hypothetical protein F511_36227 [Dorcoceras hygrometricum]|uniref:BRCT domain-containing protein n=1 Tax=Dorcoceras hygrometricum TaxID=472368 RepID=A0A2Z7A7N5_9LAMI|nr:hypothetical protein F511_36227 [Dorcoceras hygrometricum]
MGTLGGVENGNHTNSRKNDFEYLSDMETQQVDSQFSPGGDLRVDGADDFHYPFSTMPVDDDFLLEDAPFSTMPVDDDFLLEDALETQLVDLAEETQLVGIVEESQSSYLAGETQLMDLAWDTQVLDDFDCVNHEPTQLLDQSGETQVLDDFNCVNDIPTELSNANNIDACDASDNDKADKTEVRCDTQQFFPDDSLKGHGRDLAIHVNMVDASSGNQGESVLRTPSDCFTAKEHHSGSFCRDFTSIRASSVRASGLAARARGASGKLCSFSREKSSFEQQRCEQEGTFLSGDLFKFGRKNNEECLWNGNDESNEKLRDPIRKGSNTMRKLFTEDRAVEVCQSEANNNQTDGNLNTAELDASEVHLAGLSYVNSEEPGDLSQANALEVVDRFLELNVMEHDQSSGCRINVAEKPMVIKVVKGSRDLAKNSILRSAGVECRAYDWDDTREDEGGGDFFQKKKELFFDKGSPQERTYSEARKSCCADLTKTKIDGDLGIEKKQAKCKKKPGHPAYTDSGMHTRRRAKGKSFHCRDEVLNLKKDLDNQSNVASAHKLTENVSSRDISDLKNVGPDTQMAAEALGTFCMELHSLNTSNDVPDEGVAPITNTSAENRSSDGVVTRQAKRVMRTSSNTSNDSTFSSVKQTKNITNQCDADPRRAEQSRLADVNDDFVLYSKEERQSTIPPRMEEQKAGRARKRSIIQESDPNQNVELTSRKPESKHFFVQQPNSSLPVAHRTRRAKKLDGSKASGDAFHALEGITDLLSTSVIGKGRIAADDENSEMGTIKNVRKARSVMVKKSNKRCVGMCSSSLQKRSALELPDPKGTRQTAFLVEEELDAQCNATLERARENGSRRNNVDHRGSDSGKLTANLNDAVDPCTSMQCDGMGDVKTSKSSEGAETSISTCNTPATCATPVNNASPICMGDEYHKQSCRKNLSRVSLIKEVNSLLTDTSVPFSETKDLRKRKDTSNIRVLFSQHLDEDVVKQQRKVLARLGASDASSMSDATHFVADEFIRTRNMLEAIACGKPVVTHLWLESCGQASCFVNEKNYILRDARREKEFGFSMPVSLSRASQHSLLQGQKVFVTPNTKPGKDIIANLIKAVHGLAVERLGRSALKDEKLPDDLLIISCEDDYDICVAFLEKGAAVYSSELLLNGIVKQKLEYERHRLFVDRVKSTRSRIWVRKNKHHVT